MYLLEELILSRQNSTLRCNTNTPLVEACPIKPDIRNGINKVYYLESHISLLG
jgi:hypothetical protein